MIRRIFSFFLFLLLFLTACNGAPEAQIRPTLVQVTPLPTDTAVPPTPTAEPTDTPLPLEPTDTPTPLPPDPTDTPEPEPLTLAEQMDAFMMSQVDNGYFNGVALVANSEEIIFAKGYGMADRENEIANDLKTKFPIGTVTIPFTAMAIMQLQEQGKLSIEDSICDYLADCPEVWSAVQIKHLLAQSSGIRSEFSQAQYQEESGTYALTEQDIQRIQDDELYAEPGTFWQPGIDKQSYILLGLIIETVSGQPYETFLRENIFDPLGMADTGLGRDNPDRAKGYFSSSNPDPVPIKDLTPFFSAAGLVSTMDDMFLWGQALLQNRLVSQETMDSIFTFYTPMPGEGDNFHTGLGWFMSNFDGRDYSASMLGVDLFGFKTDMVVFPNDDLMWIILANQDVNSSTIGDTLSRMVLDRE